MLRYLKIFYDGEYGSVAWFLDSAVIKSQYLPMWRIDRIVDDILDRFPYARCELKHGIHTIIL